MQANILKKVQILLFIGLSAIVLGCGKGCKKSKLEVNVDDISLTIDYKRFDQDLFKCKTESDLRDLKNAYGSFYNDFVFGMMRFKVIDGDSLCTKAVIDLVENKDILSLYDSTQKVFLDDAFVKTGLTDAMKHYRHYFQADAIPKFISYISIFYLQNCIGEDYVGIGLDMYLGKNFVYYTDQRLEFPQFLIDKLEKQYLVRNTVKIFIEDRFKTNPSNVFLERAVQEGKIYYMLDALCPEMPDTIKIQYSNDKLNWMKEVEKEMWVDLVNRKVLYSKNNSENEKYFNDGPFTNATNVSRDSPPRVGEWLGWQIVRKYMESHPDITLAQLMEERDLMKIFKDSGYRPM
jgi:hypothetical protein